eukprot:2085010-Pleurochrysis_carterae.AAC.2
MAQASAIACAVPRGSSVAVPGKRQAGKRWEASSGAQSSSHSRSGASISVTASRLLSSSSGVAASAPLRSSSMSASPLSCARESMIGTAPGAHATRNVGACVSAPSEEALGTRVKAGEAA